jgi:hypothetical protein
MSVMILWEQNIGYNPLIESSVGPIKQVITNDFAYENERMNLFISGTETLIIQLGKSMIPYFIFFIPLGVFFLFKKIEIKKTSIIVIMILGLISSGYILSEIKDMRYIFWLFPFYAIISGYAVEFYLKKIKIRNIFCTLLIVGIFISSFIFLNYTDQREIQYEAFTIAKKIENQNISINKFTDVSAYIESFPILNNSKIPFNSKFIQKSSPQLVTILKLLTVEEYIEQG